ncbi:MAG: DUF4271 domain-containing protein [Bacteroidetes bacterium]|nr:DUF4271 domain-containing protein [Bacteroidota bacterium]
MLRRVNILLYFMLALHLTVLSQRNDSIVVHKDSVTLQQDTLASKAKDTASVIKDSALKINPVPVVRTYQQAVQYLLDSNHFLNATAKPVLMVVKPKVNKPVDIFFYVLAALVLVLALIRFYYARYFSNLFRVFFNTSLRQSQLADQLVQAKLPSLFFNIFFIVSAGIYIYFLLRQYNMVAGGYQWLVLLSCILVLAVIYFAKFTILKFTGWLTGYKEATNTYIFIIFMICKIIGVILIPFIVLMAFSDGNIAATSALVSLLIVGFMLLLRFFRSYGLIQNQLKVSRFHFLLYIAGVEILPLLLIYKGLLILLSKNL